MLTINKELMILQSLNTQFALLRPPRLNVQLWECAAPFSTGSCHARTLVRRGGGFSFLLSPGSARQEGSREGKPGASHSRGRGVLYLRVHALLILRSFKATITLDRSGKQTRKQLKEGQRKAGFLSPNTVLDGCSWRTGSADGFRGSERLQQPLVHRPGREVGYSGLLPAHSAGARQESSSASWLTLPVLSTRTLMLAQELRAQVKSQPC